MYMICPVSPPKRAQTAVVCLFEQQRVDLDYLICFIQYKRNRARSNKFINSSAGTAVYGSYDNSIRFESRVGMF